MKHIRRQRSFKAAIQQMVDITPGDIVIVHIRGKKIPCVVRLCNTTCGETVCSSCVLRYENCMLYRGLGCPRAFIPIEEAVE